MAPRSPCGCGITCPAECLSVRQRRSALCCAYRKPHPANGAGILTLVWSNYRAVWVQACLERDEPCARVILQKVKVLGAMRSRCSKSGVSLILRLNSLFAPQNSLLGVQKFPVPMHREFSCKSLNWLPNWARKSCKKAGIDKIPC
jgi:hypothetical protein